MGECDNGRNVEEETFHLFLKTSHQISVFPASASNKLPIPTGGDSQIVRGVPI